MRLEDMLKDISGITNQVVKTNCFEGQNTLLESILLLQTKMNEVIQSINDGIIKGDKGDTPNVQVGSTETLEPNSNASVTQTGDMLNPIFNFGIPKGEKGDKGDTGKASESIQDDVTSLDSTWSSSKIDSLFKNIEDSEGVKYTIEDNFYSIDGSKNGVISDIKLEGKTLVVDSNNQVELAGSEGAMLKSVGDGVIEIKLKSLYRNILDFKKMLENASSYTFDSGEYLINLNSNLYFKGYDIYTDGRINFSCYVKNVTATNFRLRVVYTDDTFTESNSSTSTTNYTLINVTSAQGKKVKRVVFNWSSIGSVYIKEPQIIISNSYQNYTEYIENTKKVLYKDTDGTWKKPILREWDSIEKHSDGKYYYHKRSDVIILNGDSDERWYINKQEGTKARFTSNLKRTGVLNNSTIIVDKTKSNSLNDYNNMVVGLFNGVDWGLTVDDANVTNETTLKAKLQNENLTVVYKLITEQVFECTPIDLISYDSQTNYSVECGTIYPKSSLIVKSNYGNVLSNLINRMSQIENEITEDRKAILRGDFRLIAEKSFPNDFIKEEELTNE